MEWIYIYCTFRHILWIPAQNWLLHAMMNLLLWMLALHVLYYPDTSGKISPRGWSWWFSMFWHSFIAQSSPTLSFIFLTHIYTSILFTNLTSNLPLTSGPLNSCTFILRLAFPPQQCITPVAVSLVAYLSYTFSLLFSSPHHQVPITPLLDLWSDSRSYLWCR